MSLKVEIEEFFRKYPPKNDPYRELVQQIALELAAKAQHSPIQRIERLGYDLNKFLKVLDIVVFHINMEQAATNLIRSDLRLHLRQIDNALSKLAYLMEQPKSAFIVALNLDNYGEFSKLREKLLRIASNSLAVIKSCEDSGNPINFPGIRGTYKRLRQKREAGKTSQRNTVIKAVLIDIREKFRRIPRSLIVDIFCTEVLNKFFNVVSEETAVLRVMADVPRSLKKDGLDLGRLTRCIDAIPRLPEEIEDLTDIGFALYPFEEDYLGNPRTR